MSDEASSSQDITITVKGPSELKLSITISASKTVADLKSEIASKSEVEKERQRLIYSVLKDEDPISQYKIQNGHTIHMVKGAPKTTQPSSSTSGATPAQTQRLPQMGTGLNVAGNPVDSIENIQHGLAGFNPFAGMNGMENLGDPNAMANMMQNPEFLRSMSEMMSRPEVVDQIIAANPQLAPMAPQIRQTMQNPMIRQMMSNPETLRMMMQMQAAMGQNGGGGMGGLGGMGFGGMGGNPFGAPGGATGAGTQSPPTDPFPNLFAPQAARPSGAGTETPSTGTGGTQPGAQGQAPNPFAGMFGFPGTGAGAGANAGAGTGANPFGAFDPSMLFGGGGGGWNPPSRDTRPPEEIYATQLGQLNAMGLWDAQKNITALRRTGGNVEAAIELIFSGQLDAA